MPWLAKSCATLAGQPPRRKRGNRYTKSIKTYIFKAAEQESEIFFGLVLIRFVDIISVNGIGVIHTCIYVHIYVHSIWLTPASFGSRHDLTLVVRSQTKRQQSAHSTKDQDLHSCHN